MRTESRTFRQVRRGVGGWGGVGPGGGRGGASLSRRAPSIGKNIKKTTKKKGICAATVGVGGGG